MFTKLVEILFFANCVESNHSHVLLEKFFQILSKICLQKIISFIFPQLVIISIFNKSLKFANFQKILIGFVVAATRVVL